MRGQHRNLRSLAAVLVLALIAPAGLVAAGHSYFNSTYYCSINSTANGAAGSKAVPEGSTVTHRVTFCQTYTGYTTAASYFGSTRVDTGPTLHLNAGQSGGITMSFSSGNPGAKELYAYIVASFATPSPSLYNGYDHVDLTVVGNPSTPGLSEDHMPASWSTHPHPHWLWSASAASGSITQYEVDPTWAASFTTTSTSYHPTLGSGAYGVRVRAQNNVGVWGPWSGTLTTYVDTSPPATSLSLAGTAGANGWWRSNPTATLAASDPHSGVASTSKALDGGAFGAYSGPFSITGEGAHTLQYFSADNVGNTEATKSSAVNVDTVAPSTAFSVSAPSVAQGGRTFVTSASRVTLTASDATSGAASTFKALDGGAFSAYSGPFGITGEGPHSLTFSSTDVAGNPEAAQNRALFLDNTAPVSQLAAGSPNVPDAAGAFVTSATPISVGATDAGVGVGASYHRVNAGAWLEGSPFTLPGPDGRYAVQAYAQDKLGNTESPPKGAAYQVDNTPPSLDFTAPAPDTLTALGQTIPIPLPDCGAGVPCAAPLLSKANRPAVILGGSVVALRSDAADPVVNGVASGMAAVRYALDGQPIGAASSAPWTVAWDTRAVAGGPHTLTATAVDRLGNAASVDRSVFVLVATPEGAAATPPYLLSLVAPPGIPTLPPVTPPGVPGVPTLPPITPPGVPGVPPLPPPPTLPPLGPPGVPAVRPVFSAVLDPNERSLHYKVGLEVNGQFIGDERTIDV